MLPVVRACFTLPHLPLLPERRYTVGLFPRPPHPPALVSPSPTPGKELLSRPTPWLGQRGGVSPNNNFFVYAFTDDMIRFPVHA